MIYMTAGLYTGEGLYCDILGYGIFGVEVKVKAVSDLLVTPYQTMWCHKSKGSNIKKLPYCLNIFQIIPLIFLTKLLCQFLPKPMCLSL
jgi:hypothetical protein